MSRRDLNAAEIIDPALRASYEACRQINAAHGRTFYLATLLLPAEKRPAVHALYGFARHADDIVDDLSPHLTVGQREKELASWADRFFSGTADDALLPAVYDTIDRYGVPLEYFADFLASMRMDLTTSSYATWDDLMSYMHGSAAVIGLQMLHVLGTSTDSAPDPMPYARDLGIAFQLTNFIRDVGEDLRRNRVYLPSEDLAEFGLTRDDLAAGRTDDRIRRLLAFQIGRARALYRQAAPGIALLAPPSRDCVRTAATLYSDILVEVEAADYAVLDQRVAVRLRRRVAVALPALARARRSRHC